ncbi:nuclear pore complex protein Nup93-1-like [Drosophila albomicans]|uniref:Nuclear pore protein n=1 Tax=Drosophila albomicans TaxID=7291 RepID=A0A6P8W988_DROAB|nr:nuclear pore complex protein Nup93-1-like [Drosophila albomicans]
MNPSLSELLERAKCLVNQTTMGTTAQLPVELTLPEVLQKADEMHTRLTGQSMDSQRTIQMFSQSGIDMSKMARKVQNLQCMIFEPDEMPDTDVPGLLQRMQQKSIIDIIEETNANVFKTIEKRRWQWQFQEWEDEKQRLFNEFDQSDTKTATVVMSNAVISSLNRIKQLYAEEIISYNNNQQRRVSLLSTFTQLAQQQLHDEQVTKMWQVLEHMAKESSSCIKARQQSPQFAQQALLYVEQGYRQYIRSSLRRSRIGFKCGGIPSLYHKVKNFVCIKLQEWQSLIDFVDVVRRRPLWPHVFYSLRCGHLPSAVQFLKDWEDPQPELRELLELMHQFKTDPKLIELNSHYERLKMRLVNEYKERLSQCSDPFLKAVFAIVLDCDPVNLHGQVLQSLEDLVWAQLMLRRDLQTPLTISDVEGMMHYAYGSNYLNIAGTIPIFFQLLVLTGYFEAALEYLSRTEANEVHAVHMAIALNELSLLGVASNELEPMLGSHTDDASVLCRLNVVRLIINYAKRFEETDVYEAMNYYFLLRHYQSIDGSSLMLNVIGEFMIRNFRPQMLDLMFGKPDPNEPTFYAGGMLDRLPSTNFDKNALASKLAHDLTKRCKYEAAIEMHLITGQLDKAMDLMCCLLAQRLHINSPKENLRMILTKLTNRLYSGGAPCSLFLSSNEILAFKLLSKLMKFFDRFHAGDYDQALEVLDDTELIPKSYLEVDFCLSKVKMLGADAVKVFPNVLLSTMKIYFRQYKKQKSQQSGAMLLLRERAKVLINFAAYLPHRLPPNINMRLVKMELQMQDN